MKDEEFDELANKIADQIVKRLYGIQNSIKNAKPYESEDTIWYADNDEDHIIGELARLMTLNNLYEEREEYEKCHLIAPHIDRLTKIVDNLE
jgi:hypothetical protein|tara:strand:- start:5259 stop:5534 length:276 start_codon:yes stop_codon:yes gene_type:complete